MTQEESNTIKRWIGLGMDGHKTSIHIAEFCNGDMGITLRTERDGMPPIQTDMKFSPKTYSLLAEAMFTAAHGNPYWQYPTPNEETK